MPNLETRLARVGAAVSTALSPADYLPGDIVSWRLPDGRPHIGILSDQRAADGETPKVLHNIGAGVRVDDILFAYEVAGHYRLDAASHFRLRRLAATGQ